MKPAEARARELAEKMQEAVRDKHIAALRESGLSIAAIAERTGLSKSAVLQKLAREMKRGGSGVISKSGIQVRP
jgi:lambda repressor-like predicted transcriptional regulator